jgi:hypothetical protein
MIIGHSDRVNFADILLEGSEQGSPFWPGQAGVEFQPALAPLPAEHVVEKNVPDAFINTRQVEDQMPHN